MDCGSNDLLPTRLPTLVKLKMPLFSKSEGLVSTQWVINNVFVVVVFFEEIKPKKKPYNPVISWNILYLMLARRCSNYTTFHTYYFFSNYISSFRVFISSLKVGVRKALI